LKDGIEIVLGKSVLTVTEYCGETLLILRNRKDPRENDDCTLLDIVGIRCAGRD
jgi:hypothetical protein